MADGLLNVSDGKATKPCERNRCFLPFDASVLSCCSVLMKDTTSFCVQGHIGAFPMRKSRICVLWFEAKSCLYGMKLLKIRDLSKECASESLSDRSQNHRMRIEAMAPLARERRIGGGEGEAGPAPRPLA